jgi:hypothetical protein
VTHVATALNHLTVLEFKEPVTLAAAGSADFQIERQENKVFIKPMKAGASTDLFVWTASQRFAYELETTLEVKNMNFAIDHSAPPTLTPPPASTSRADNFADMMLTRVLLGAQQITAVGHATKNQVAVQVEQVFRTRSTVYVLYTIVNNTDTSYRAADPAAFQLQLNNASILSRLMHKQLDDRTLRKLRNTREAGLPIGHGEIESQDLEPGETTQGVVAIRQDLASPAVVQLVFQGDRKATFVL